MTPKELQKIFRECWTMETADNPWEWTPENPAWGQCVATTLTAQDFLGGDIITGWARNKRLCFLMHHNWNILPDGRKIDFTKEQFPKGTAFLKSKIIKSSKNVRPFSSPVERKRYALLRLAVENKIHPNPLFSDETYRLCFEAAQSSECQKMKFGCLVVCQNKIIAATTNKFIEPLKHLCEPECIRLKIQSRTESMIGACGHAEEWALKKIFELKINPRLCSLYIAGFDAKTNNPWLKRETADFSCLRCAVQMYMADLGKIYVPFIDRWESLTAKEAVEKSAAYALKERKI